MKHTLKKLTAIITAVIMALSLMACGSSGGSEAAAPAGDAPAQTEAQPEEAAPAAAPSEAAASEAPSEAAAAEKASEAAPAETAPEGEAVEIQVFIAASLNTVMQEVATKFNELHPEVKIVFNADSSG